MISFQVKAVLAGICFGLWPLFINKSGLNGFFSTFFLAVVMLICVSPFVVTNFGDIFSADLKMAIAAGLFNVVGIFIFNDMLSKASSKEVGPLIILMISAQISVVAAYHAFIAKGMTVWKGLGFILAAIGVILLLL